jgi:hypothetical protein
MGEKRYDNNVGENVDNRTKNDNRRDGRMWAMGKRITVIARKEAGHSKKPGKNCKEKTTNARKILKNNKKEQVQESTKKGQGFWKG